MKILLTGGGSAGHVMPHLALLPYFKAAGDDLYYIGSKSGIEKTLIEKEGIPYKGIASGKLRRYIDFKNLTDIFRVVFGTLQATFYIRRLKPQVLFSKGGFVSVPVAIGAYLNRVPVIIHESDMTPGLANKIALKFCKKVCTTFEETLKYLPKEKAIHTGSPIRSALLEGDRAAGLSMCGFREEKPVILLTGGSLGARALNDTLRASLNNLLKDFNVIHLCGKGHIDSSLLNRQGYVQYEFIGDQLADLFAATDLVIARAGSNTITEVAALALPNILIPLPASQSRGDQILNAKAYEQAGYSFLLNEEDLTSTTLEAAVHQVYDHRHTYINAMRTSGQVNGTKAILDVIHGV